MEKDKYSSDRKMLGPEDSEPDKKLKGKPGSVVPHTGLVGVVERAADR